MGTSAHPLASGSPPNTRGGRMRAVAADDVGKGARSVTGTPGITGKEDLRGSEARRCSEGRQAGMHSSGAGCRGAGTGDAGIPARTSAVVSEGTVAPPAARSRRAAAAVRSEPLGSAVYTGMWSYSVVKTALTKA